MEGVAATHQARSCCVANGQQGARAAGQPYRRVGEQTLGHLRRPLVMKETEDCNLPSVCSSFQAATFGGFGRFPPPGYRSRDALGQSATQRREGGLGHSVGLRVKASYSVTSSNEVYDSCCTCGGGPHTYHLAFATSTDEGVGLRLMCRGASPWRVAPPALGRFTDPLEQR